MSCLTACAPAVVRPFMKCAVASDRDVWMTLGPAAGSAFDPPEEALVAIETLLPTGKGKFLELWASPEAQRPGWTHIAAAAKRA